MKKITLLAIISLSITHGYSQRIVTLTSIPQKVPNGKKWMLETNREILIEVSNGSKKSGTMCNAILTSGICYFSIAEGEYGRPNESYTMVFKKLDKVHYTNDRTYNLVPISIFNSKKNNELDYSKAEEINEGSAVFYPDQEVAVGTTCLQSIQISEYDLNEIDTRLKNKKLQQERTKKENEPKTEVQATIFAFAEEMPKAPYDINIYTKKAIKYPDSAKNNNIEGSVNVRMVINEDGSIAEPKVIRGIGYGCDEEALRIVNNMPKWNAGKQNGKAVKVYYTLSIYFHLN